jgi:hypothetical protein
MDEPFLEAGVLGEAQSSVALMAGGLSARTLRTT